MDKKSLWGLWGVVVGFRFFLGSFRLFGGDPWQLEDDRGEKPAGKTWLEDGENVVRRGRLCGTRELLMDRRSCGLERLASDVQILVESSRSKNSIRRAGEWVSRLAIVVASGLQSSC